MSASERTAAAVVVTFNRKNLLGECLEALLAQTHPLRKIVIVDNASTDGTEEYLRPRGYLDRREIDYVRLAHNMGGAGGFYEGVNRLYEQGAGWIWLMDDDVRPDADALEQLLLRADHEGDVYGSLALASNAEPDRLCWPAQVVGDPGGWKHSERDLPALDLVQVPGLPFLGLLIHTKLVGKIGLPDRDLFITGDDLDYCERAKRVGARLYLVKASVVRHPLPDTDLFKFLGRWFVHQNQPPWRRYYEIRNRIVLGRRYHGYRLWTQTLPSVVVRMLHTLASERKGRWLQVRAFAKGIKDGFLGRLGKRVAPPEPK